VTINRSPEHPLTVLCDGECPFCKVEVRYMARFDRHNRLALVDLAAPGFDPAHFGATMEDSMGTLHGVRPDGSKTTGLKTFREIYRALGVGWILAPTGWPILKQVSDWIYALFARNRVLLGGMFGRQCEAGRCAVPQSAAGGRNKD